MELFLRLLVLNRLRHQAHRRLEPLIGWRVPAPRGGEVVQRARGCSAAALAVWGVANRPGQQSAKSTLQCTVHVAQGMLELSLNGLLLSLWSPGAQAARQPPAPPARSPARRIPRGTPTASLWLSSQPTPQRTPSPTHARTTRPASQQPESPANRTPQAASGAHRRTARECTASAARLGSQSPSCRPSTEVAAPRKAVAGCTPSVAWHHSRLTSSWGLYLQEARGDGSSSVSQGVFHERCWLEWREKRCDGMQ